MGRVALVTGGTRGIGRAISVALKEVGYTVAANYGGNDAAAEAFNAETGIPAFKSDVGDYAACEAGLAAVEADAGPVEVMVNNAGIIRDGLLATMDHDQWQEVLDTNLGSVYRFSKAVTRPMMSQRHGRIINISSVASHFGNPGQANYAASKGGIEGMTRCLATELGRRGITVNAVAPGFIETDMTEAIRNVAEKEIIKKISCRRLGSPEDIAHATAFLASDEASYVTGHVLVVDGGLTLGGL